VECKEQFVFSAGEQIFFSEKQFQHEPRHCKTCRAKRGNLRVRVETSVTRAACGSSTIVPFRPRKERPVLCRVCFLQQRDRASVPPQALEPV
jgi:CxxC-x17-CxxC domain-containing protein